MLAEPPPSQRRGANNAPCDQELPDRSLLLSLVLRPLLEQFFDALLVAYHVRHLYLPDEGDRL